MLIPPKPLLILLLSTLLLLNGCASKGLLTDRYDPEEIAVPRLLPEDTSQMNPIFLVTGDEQKGRRIIEKFFKQENWATWWQLAVPFYQIYLFSNGFIGGINALRQVPDAGDESRMMMRKVLYRDAQKFRADFILETGDMAAADGRYPDHWEVFLEGKKWSHPFLSEIPYVPTVGNHEWANDTTYAWPNYQAVFSYPRFYTLEFKEAVLLVLDSNFLIDQWKLIDEDEQERLYAEWFISDDGSSWLEQQLDKYKDKPFKVVSMHHPPITYGWHSQDWYTDSYGKNLTKKRVKLLHLFADYGVNVVFSGHEHLYQHSVVTLQDRPEVGPMHFITSSGGGVPLRSKPSESFVKEMLDRYQDEGITVNPPTMLSEYHYCKVQVGSDSMVVETMLVDQDSDEYETSLWERIIFRR